MRVTSALWVAALVRRYNSAGAAATLARRGAEEAGAIFVVVDRLDGNVDLYGPAPQSIFGEAHPGDRRFERMVEGPAATVAARLEREISFDPDVWIVEIEDREARILFDLS